MRKISIGLSFLAFIYFLSACTSDQTPAVTSQCENVAVSYNTNMQAIIDLHCSYSGCHDGNHADSDVRDYTGYTGMLTDINSGKFASEVRSFSMPEDHKMPDSDFALMDCWIELGFPE